MSPVVSGLLSLGALAGILLGWLVPLAFGVRRLRRGRGGKVLTAIGGVWGVVVLGLALWTFKIYHDMQRRYNHEEAAFDPASHKGGVATLEVGYGYPTELEVRQIDGDKAVWWKTAASNGVAAVPAGRLALESVSVSVADGQGAKQGTLYVSLASTNETVTLAAGERKRLAGGFPLTASIDAKKGSDGLSLNFKMMDVAGNRMSWYPAGQDRRPPAFEAVAPDGSCIWRDNFEYG